MIIKFLHIEELSPKTRKVLVDLGWAEFTLANAGSRAVLTVDQNGLSRKELASLLTLNSFIMITRGPAPNQFHVILNKKRAR